MDSKSEKIFTKSFFLAFGALFFTAMVMYTLMSTVTEYASSMGSTAAVAGLVSGIYVFGGLCSRVYSGNAMQKHGWKRTAVIFLGIHFIACLFYFLVHNTAMLLIVRFIHGIGFGAASNAIVTIGMSVLPKKRFSEACGYFMMGTTLAVGIGPYIGGILYDKTGSTGCFIAASACCALAFVCIALIDVSETDPGSRKNRMAAKSDGEEDHIGKTYSGIEKVFELGAIPISVTTALTTLGYVAILSFYRLYAAQVHLEGVFSWFFLLYSAILLLSRPIAGKLQDKYGDKIVCYTGILVQSIGIFLIAWKPCTLTVILCAIGAALGYGTLNSACNAIACRNATPERRSYAVSTFYIFCDAGMGFGPALLGSFVSSNSGYAPIYLISSVITLLALPVCIYSLRQGSGVESTIKSLHIRNEADSAE